MSPPYSPQYSPLTSNIDLASFPLVLRRPSSSATATPVSVSPPYSPIYAPPYSPITSNSNLSSLYHPHSPTTTTAAPATTATTATTRTTTSKSHRRSSPRPVPQVQVLSHIDDIGTHILLRPIRYLTDLELLNFFDNLGIIFVCKPLRLIQRLAEILLGIDADERCVSSLDAALWAAGLERVLK